MIDVPDTQTPRRTDRKLCAHCEASASGCRSNEWLRGRRCCTACAGDHDQPPKGVNAPDSGPVATSARPTDGSERVISSRTDLPAPSHDTTTTERKS